MSKLSFRARALDASKPMPIFLAEELPDLPEYSAINRAVPQMPSGMEKEEECEHHLQRAICTGLIIPTPEVYEVNDLHFYERCYPPDYKMPKQHIHMQPLWQEQETPEYDIDSDDERWLKQQRHPELTELKFEQMMDKLERSSGQTVVTLKEAKLLLERHDDLVIAVYDYWLNKRLKTQHPLILSVKTEHRPGQSSNNPYLAFRRRTEKMQTRKNRKNDESSYEKMLKLRRDLGRAVTLLALVARREDTKRELVRLTALLAERRYAAGEFSHHLATDAPPRPSVSSVHVAANVRREYATPYPPRDVPAPLDQPRQREKRPYKRRKHRHHVPGSAQGLRDSGVYTSSEEEGTRDVTAPPDDGPFAFRRKPGCFYEMPTSTLCGDPVDPETDTNVEFKHEIDERYRFSLTSVRAGCAGLARARAGRGGRALLDRRAHPLGDLFPRLPFDHHDTHTQMMELETKLHRTPKTVSLDYHASGKYPWRHAFRKHLARNPHLWIDQNADKTPADLEIPENLKLPDIKRELTDTDKVRDSEIKSDISVSARTMDRAVRENLRRVVRKRTWSGSSDSSYDSDESLYPVEKEFQKFINEVDKTWLHFRPKTPPPPPPEEDKPTNDVFPLTANTPITVEVRTESSPSGMLDTFTTSEFTLSQLYPDMGSPENEVDLSGDDILNDNLGLTEAQVESMLSDTDLKALADVDLTKDEKGKLPDDLLEELVKDVDTKDSFLLHGQGSEGRANSGQRKKKAEAFGSTTVHISGMGKEPIYIEKEVQKELPKKIETPKKKEIKAEPAPVPTSKIIVEEVNEVPHIKIEKRKKDKEDTIEEVQLAHGVQLKTVHAVNSPVKKHIITSHRRTSDVTLVTSQGQSTTEQPHLVTVAVSENLKVRLQNHLSVSQAAAVGVVSGVGAVGVGGVGVVSGVGTVGTVSAVGANGPFPAPLAVAVPIHHHTGGGGSGGPGRRAAPVVGVRPLGAPVVLQHQLAPGKLKVVHAAHLTHNQRSQLLAHSRATGITQLPAVVSLAPLGDAKSSNTALLKAGPGSVAQYFEIKGGQLGKGPHLVNVLRHPAPPRADKRQVVAFDGTIKGNVAVPQTRPHKVSLSLDGRQLAAVRTAVPVRHQIQIKNRTVQVAPHQPSTSMTLAQTKTAIPSSVVANLIHKNVQLPKGGQKIAISGPGGQLLANVQARLIAQPRPQPVAEIAESLPAAPTAGGAEGEAEGEARRGERGERGEVLPMEVT